jgi:hypothetical protein
LPRYVVVGFGVHVLLRLLPLLGMGTPRFFKVEFPF